MAESSPRSPVVVAAASVTARGQRPRRRARSASPFRLTVKSIPTCWRPSTLSPPRRPRPRGLYNAMVRRQHTTPGPALRRSNVPSDAAPAGGSEVAATCLHRRPWSSPVPNFTTGSRRQWVACPDAPFPSCLTPDLGRPPPALLVELGSGGVFVAKPKPLAGRGRACRQPVTRTSAWCSTLASTAAEAGSPTDEKELGCPVRAVILFLSRQGLPEMPALPGRARDARMRRVAVCGDNPDRS